MSDAVKHPSHYTSHPSGVECIEITKHMGFNLGNALKYIWRCDLKKDAIEDLRKARQYLDIEIEMREKKAKRDQEEADAKWDRELAAHRKRYAPSYKDYVTEYERTNSYPTTSRYGRYRNIYR